MAEENKLFYKFRNLESVFDYKELENQEIYFALPEELNDPMDCQPKIVFEGDNILWLNLLRNLLVNLTSDAMLINCINHPTIPFSSQYYDMTSSMSLLHNEYLNKLYNDVYSYLENDLETISNILAKFDKPIPKDFVSIILFKIMDLYISVLDKYTHKNKLHKDKYNNYINEIINTINFFKDIDTEVYDYRKFSDILAYYNTKNDEYKKHFTFDFFMNYINRFNEFLFPYIRIASFSKIYSNTLMWSHYADEHKGICMIFNVPCINNLYKFDLILNDKKEPFFYPFEQVKYIEKKTDINLFTNNYITLFEKFYKDWFYHPKTNKKSKYAPNSSVYDRDTILKLGRTFLESFFVKSKEWEYEKECRMIILNANSNKQNIRYNFSSLNGIIFGIKTPLKDKLKVIDIIQEKCKKENRENFNFYQAYYNADKNKIDTYLIDDKLFMEHK